MTDELPFKVVRSNGTDDVLARSVNMLIARGAYRAAARLYPEDLRVDRIACLSIRSIESRRSSGRGARRPGSHASSGPPKKAESHGNRRGYPALNRTTKGRIQGVERLRTGKPQRSYHTSSRIACIIQDRRTAGAGGCDPSRPVTHSILTIHQH
jgi:hypothetical protein